MFEIKFPFIIKLEVKLKIVHGLCTVFNWVAYYEYTFKQNVTQIFAEQKTVVEYKRVHLKNYMLHFFPPSLDHSLRKTFTSVCSNS